ncbi:MAG: hypothetical protein ACRD2Y_16920 [Terriglobales bacterium]
MPKINARRVLLGGLVAGVFSNLSGILMAHFVFAEEARALAQRMNVELGPGTGLLHLTTRFAVMIGLVWLYAAIRPRFGPGPRTAALAGLAVWLFTFGFSFLTHLPYGFYSLRTLAILPVWSLVEMQVAAQIGAYLYREEA